MSSVDVDSISLFSFIHTYRIEFTPDKSIWVAEADNKVAQSPCCHGALIKR